jgi:integrase
MAAMKLYSIAYELKLFQDEKALAILIRALINKFTTEPLKRTPTFHEALPSIMSNFANAYVPFERMDELTLRNRCIFLISLLGFARPSDLGMETWHRESIKFERHHEDTGNDKRFMSFWLLRTKNDYKRIGFQMRVYESQLINTCPVRHLERYLTRTARIAKMASSLDVHGNSKTPVFLSVPGNPAPTRFSRVKALRNGSLARIMTSVLRSLGVTNPNITAKSFRPTAATAAHRKHISLDEILDLGRWSHLSKPILLTHYIRKSDMHNITDKLLKTKEQNSSLSESDEDYSSMLSEEYDDSGDEDSSSEEVEES